MDTYFYGRFAEHSLLGVDCAGLGHGVVEAVINPVCASIYNKEKSKMLNILHASWPAGFVIGGILMLTPGLRDLSWNLKALWIVIPVFCYGVMFIKAKFPVDERVQISPLFGNVERG